ncbi:MAG: LamG domain-containing protein, partial [Treponema sp.]|nr:LamG domain-containing protein [Treponema sp.]
MRKEPLGILLFYLFFLISGSLYAAGEKTFSIGGAASWEAAEVRAGVTEVTRVRPNPVLVLSSAVHAPKNAGNSSDLAVSFDEAAPDRYTDSAGNYRVTASPALSAVDRRFARGGTGAALFPGASFAAGGKGSGAEGPLVIEAINSGALFAAGNRIGDFSLEFWLYPLNMENGEEILTWISSRPLPGSAGRTREYVFQRVQCTAVKNRLQWTFLDFFSDPGGRKHVSVSLLGDAPVVPKTWSHHLIRFDSGTGLLEYLVDGSPQAIEYANAAGREGGEVYIPIVGEGGSFVLGNRFMGLIDEFRIHRAWLGRPETRKYPLRGGRVETRAIDLGEGAGFVLKIDALGGRAAIPGGNGFGEYREQGDFRFTDDSQMQFFVRAADNPYRWTDADWRPFIPGTALRENLRGRYVQLAADFYPSEDGEASPYLEELRITYRPDEAPLPPAAVAAVARNGAVELSWKNSPDTDTAGYLIYYGSARGEYFGNNAILG